MSSSATQNINGTPSANNRDVSHSEASTLSSQFYSPTNHPTVSSNAEKQPGVDHEESKSGFGLKKAQVVVDNDDASSTFSQKDPIRPPIGSRQHTYPSVAAAPYVNSWIPNDVEKQGSASRTSSRPRRTSDASTVSPDQNADALPSRVSTDAYGNSYPEGGLQAYLCVFGSFCGLMAALGMMNTIGTYQAYLSRNQLKTISSSQIGWIFGIYSFLSFFLGIQIGPMFDAYGPRLLVFVGSIFLVVSQLLIAQSTAYWHFILSFGLLGGTGTSLIFTPAISAIGHHFLRKRGQYVGLAAAGGSCGGVVFPLALRSLIPATNFAWSCRIIALCNLVLLIGANLCIRSRLPRSSRILLRDILPDFTIFKDITFTFTTVGVFATEWALFIPISYMTSYALSYNPNQQALAYHILPILNAGSCIGRYFPGYLADRIGRFNSLILTILFCSILVLGLWLPAQGSMSITIAFVFIFGIASGSGISLTPVCVGQLCKTENLGRYYATCYTVASFATLTGIPIAGAIIASEGGKGNWNGLILFTGSSYLVALMAFTMARISGVGWKIGKIY